MLVVAGSSSSSPLVMRTATAPFLTRTATALHRTSFSSPGVPTRKQHPNVVLFPAISSNSRHPQSVVDAKGEGFRPALWRPAAHSALPGDQVVRSPGALTPVRGMGGPAAAPAEHATAAAASREPRALPLGPAPSGNKVRVALCQLSVTKDRDANIDHAKKAIEKAADQGAQLVVLPEIWNCPYSNASFPVYAELLDDGSSPSASMLSSVALAKRVTIVGGSIPERAGDRLYNTCLVYDSDGQLKAKHRKLHLFDIDIPGKITFKESETLSPGDTLTVADTAVGRIGVGICYDIRFPELAMLYAARGVHIICYPGAFNMTTGPLHWELLTRARAVDNQVFVATCSPARDLGSSYHAWGHSTVVGPFGEVLATTEHEEDTVFADLDYSLLDERRRNMPLGEQRRGDLYKLVNRVA